MIWPEVIRYEATGDQPGRTRAHLRHPPMWRISPKTSFRSFRSTPHNVGFFLPTAGYSVGESEIGWAMVRI